jgi:hypothetical protein
MQSLALQARFVVVVCTPLMTYHLWVYAVPILTSPYGVPPVASDYKNEEEICQSGRASKAC